MKEWKVVGNTEKAIGEVIRAMRLDMRMTQEEVAKAMGLARTFVVSCETGRERFSRFQLREYVKYYIEKTGDNKPETLYLPRLRKLYRNLKVKRAVAAANSLFDEIFCAKNIPLVR
jgi:transcriptional regulator with XRE-family HTH domain